MIDLEDGAKAWQDGTLIHVVRLEGVHGTQRWARVCDTQVVDRKIVRRGRRPSGLVNCLFCIGVLRAQDLARRSRQRRRP